MIGLGGRLLTAAVLLASAASSAEAQRLARTETSFGGMFTPLGAPPWGYVDSSLRVLFLTSLVGEVQVFPLTPGGVFAAGGVRQALFLSPQGEVYAQLLVGLAIGYPRNCYLCRRVGADFGLGANVRLSDQWSVRIRGDILTGGHAADIPVATLGAGVTRRWGSR